MAIQVKKKRSTRNDPHPGILDLEEVRNALGISVRTMADELGRITNGKQVVMYNRVYEWEVARRSVPGWVYIAYAQLLAERWIQAMEQARADKDQKGEVWVYQTFGNIILKGFGDLLAYLAKHKNATLNNIALTMKADLETRYAITLAVPALRAE